MTTQHCTPSEMGVAPGTCQNIGAVVMPLHTFEASPGQTPPRRITGPRVKLVLSSATYGQTALQSGLGSWHHQQQHLSVPMSRRHPFADEETEAWARELPKALKPGSGEAQIRIWILNTTPPGLW